jgi:hypothetical protein
MRTFLFLALLVGLFAVASAEEYTVKVTLLDGGEVTGILIKLSPAGVELNPGGMVKYRFIEARLIRKAYIVELDRTVDFPMPAEGEGVEGDEEDEIVDYEVTTPATYKYSVVMAMAGGAYTTVSGKYYSGFTSGAGGRAALYFLFPVSDPRAARFMMGFNYGYSSIASDLIMSNVDIRFHISEYSFEGGMVSRMLEGGHFFWFTLGFVVVNNSATASLTTGAGSTSVDVDETKAAMRLMGGVSFNLGRRIYLVPHVTVDMVLGKSSSSSSNNYYYNYSYYNNQPDITVAGWIIAPSLAIQYMF